MSNATRKTLRVSRDTVLFAAGILGVVHETIIASTERPQLLMMFAAMMGLPAFLKADEAKKGSGE